MIQQLRRRVDELRNANPRFAGLDTHPITAARIAAFEEEHDILLAESHRVWLLELGERPIVPSLIGSQCLSLAESTRHFIYECFSGPLAEDFAYSGTEPIGLEWDDARDEPVDPQPLRGTICLGHAGCDVIWVAVVAGAEKGRVWSFIPSHYEELRPTGLTIPEWNLVRVERALQSSLRGAGGT